jgi:hypothetical protein
MMRRAQLLGYPLLVPLVPRLTWPGAIIGVTTFYPAESPLSDDENVRLERYFSREIDFDALCESPMSQKDAVCSSDK